VTWLGHTRHAWSNSCVHGPCYWIKNKQWKWSKEKREKQSRRRTWCVCREFARDCWRWYFWSKFPFTPSACLPRCILFMRLCFSLIFFVFFMLYFQNNVSLSLGLFLVSWFKVDTGEGKVYFCCGVLKKSLKIKLVSLCFSLLVSFVFPLSPANLLLFGTARFI